MPIKQMDSSKLSRKTDSNRERKVVKRFMSKSRHSGKGIHNLDPKKKKERRATKKTPRHLREEKPPKKVIKSDFVEVIVSYDEEETHGSQRFRKKVKFHKNTKRA